MEETKRAPRKVSLREKTARLLGLPGESLGKLPRAELLGDRELYLENYRDILAYSREEICVAGGGWMLRLTGRELEIKAMRAGQLRIVGWVDRLELL